jgi:DNA repair protein RadC
MPERPARHRIADLQRSDRPRERLANQGPAALADGELVAILLRTGTAGWSALRLSETLLQDSGGVAGLRHIRFDDLRARHGIGAAKAAQLMAAIELGRRFALVSWGAGRSSRRMTSPSFWAEIAAGTGASGWCC